MEKDSLDYNKVLYVFVDLFYKDTIILEQVKSEAILIIIISYDEDFILLLIIVYFEDNADTDYAESYAGIDFVLRSGW